LLRILNKEGANLRRQANIGPYAFDFAALSRRVLIEIDGRIHDRADVKALDDEKATYAEKSGYSVVRIADDDIWTNPDAVLDRLRAILFGETALVRTPAPGGGGRGRGRSG
jgi:very-short-patch-repair endonuclease